MNGLQRTASSPSQLTLPGKKTPSWAHLDESQASNGTQPARPEEWIQLAKAYFLAESTMISIAELQKAIRWSTIVIRPRQAKDAIC